MKKRYIGKIGWKGHDLNESVPIVANSKKEAREIAMTYVYFVQGQSDLKKKYLGIVELEKWFSIPLENDKDGNFI